MLQLGHIRVQRGHIEDGQFVMAQVQGQLLDLLDLLEQSARELFDLRVDDFQGQLVAGVHVVEG